MSTPEEYHPNTQPPEESFVIPDIVVGPYLPKRRFNRYHPSYQSTAEQNGTILTGTFRFGPQDSFPIDWLMYAAEQFNAGQVEDDILRKLAAAEVHIRLHVNSDQSAEQISITYPAVVERTSMMDTTLPGRLSWEPNNHTTIVLNQNMNIKTLDGTEKPVTSADPLEILWHIEEEIVTKTQGAIRPKEADLANLLWKFRNNSRQIDRLFTDAAARDQLMDASQYELALMLQNNFEIIPDGEINREGVRVLMNAPTDETTLDSQVTLLKSKRSEAQNNYRSLILALLISPAELANNPDLDPPFKTYVASIHQKLQSNDWNTFIQMFGGITYCRMKPAVARNLGIPEKNNRPYALSGIIQRNPQTIAAFLEMQELDREQQWQHFQNKLRMQKTQIRISQVTGKLTPAGYLISRIGPAAGFLLGKSTQSMLGTVANVGIGLLKPPETIRLKGEAAKRFVNGTPRNQVLLSSSIEHTSKQ